MSTSRADLSIAGVVWTTGVREQINAHVFSDLRNEVGGFLLGHQGADQRLEITAGVPARSAHGRAASVTFTQDDWADVHARLQRQHPTEQIVGWYHSHPGFGIFLSEHDLFIHRNFFSAHMQVAHVLDPHAGREGLFGWRNGEVELLGEDETARPGRRPPPAGLAQPPGPPGRKLGAYLAIVLTGALIGTALALLSAQDNGNASAPASVTIRSTPVPKPGARPASGHGRRLGAAKPNAVHPLNPPR